MGSAQVVLLQGEIGEVSTASVACGVLGVAGNKGAVAVSFTVNRRRVACICSHFAAHQVHQATLPFLPILSQGHNSSYLS